MSADKTQVLNAEIPADVPEWVMVIRTGAWLGHPAGPEVITPAHIAAAHDYFQRHYKAHGNDLVIDYHHGSVLAATGQMQKAPAAGWIVDMEIRQNGTELWGRVQPWVAEARNAIAAREFRYLSPVLRFNQPDRVTGERVPMVVHSAALTNTPFLTELEALNAAAGGDQPGRGESGPLEEGGESMSILAALANALGKPPEEVASSLGMEPEAEDKQVAEALVANAARVTALEAEASHQAPVSEAVANALGVAADSDETAVKAAIFKMQAGADLSAVRRTLGLSDDADGQAVVNAIADLQKVHQDAAAEKLVGEAIETGKVIPAQRETWLKFARHDLDAARAAINSLVAMTDQAGHGNSAVGDLGPVLSEEGRLVCQQLGLDPVKFAQAG